MFGASRSTRTTRARSCAPIRAANAAAGSSVDGARAASARDTAGQPCLAEPIAFTTLPNQLGCTSPKNEIRRSPGSPDISTCAAFGFARWCSGFTGRPASSSARKYLPSTAKCAGCSRASTVFGCVPAATNTLRAGSTTSPSARQAPSSSRCWRASAIARTAPYASTSMRFGSRHSAKRMPSSSAFSTSSWFSVYEGASTSRLR